MSFGEFLLEWIRPDRDVHSNNSTEIIVSLVYDNPDYMFFLNFTLLYCTERILVIFFWSSEQV